MWDTCQRFNLSPAVHPCILLGFLSLWLLVGLGCSGSPLLCVDFLLDAWPSKWAPSLHCGVRSSPWAGVFGCGAQAPELGLQKLRAQ